MDVVRAADKSGAAEARELTPVTWTMAVLP
jgi:hypothetical protein